MHFCILLNTTDVTSTCTKHYLEVTQKERTHISFLIWTTKYGGYIIKHTELLITNDYFSHNILTIFKGHSKKT